MNLIFADTSIVHFRQSGNTPEMRCYGEMETRGQMDNMLKGMIGRLKALCEVLFRRQTVVIKVNQTLGRKTPKRFRYSPVLKPVAALKTRLNADGS